MSRQGGRSGVLGLLACVGALGMAVFSASAGAVTLGQLDPDNAGQVCVIQVFDFVQPTVTSGNSYVVPSTGGISTWTVTSWSTKASSDPAVQGLKFFRKVGDPATFMAVAHEGPHPLVPGLNTFPADLQVKAGDVLGSHWEGNGACAFDAPDTVTFLEGGNLADGAMGMFDTDSPYRLNATAEITPTSDFSFGKVKAKANGTATLQVNLPNPGDLTVAGKGVKGSTSAGSAKQVNAGKVKLVIRAKGKNKQKLNTNGKVTVKPKITFTPTGGTPTTEKKKVKLRRP